jgi:hypothetical protein
MAVFHGKIQKLDVSGNAYVQLVGGKDFVIVKSSTPLFQEFYALALTAFVKGHSVRIRTPEDHPDHVQEIGLH